MIRRSSSLMGGLTKDLNAQVGPITRAFDNKSVRRISSSTAFGIAIEKPEDVKRRSANQQLREKTADRDFYVRVLGSSSSKREAKGYLNKYDPASVAKRRPNEKGRSNEKQLALGPKHGVNLGNFYGPTRAVEDRLVFSQFPQEGRLHDAERGPLHLALVKIRDPHALDDKTLQGVGATLSQLERLGLEIVVVVDPLADGLNVETKAARQEVEKQAGRVVEALEATSGTRARHVDNALGISSTLNQASKKHSIRKDVRVAIGGLLLSPLRRGVMTVVSPVAYSSDTQQAQIVDGNDIMLALVREFAGIYSGAQIDDDPVSLREKIRNMQQEISLERLILLDPLGGIPGKNAVDRSHVFINMEQEYEDVKTDLLHQELENPLEPKEYDSSSPISPFGNSNPFSKFVEQEVSPRPSKGLSSTSLAPSDASTAALHLRNLDILERSLAILPPTSSALLTTPDEAANAGRGSEEAFDASSVGTRRQKNPLIHSLLTDKPMFSASLPSGRLGRSVDGRGQHATPTTFFKRGMPLTMLPDPRQAPWSAPVSRELTLSLNDPRIDLPRLISLIEDSFSRKLDVEHFFARIKDRVAGVIVVGEYEGCALLTWETPLGDGHRPLVPYLDKFAVRKRSQGAGGVADVLFNAMVRTCLPHGVCWRSRRDNPVNKWYFERARGTWKIPDSNWTMFWTTENVGMGSDDDMGTFLDYESVCRTIEPSWADKKHIAD